MGLKPWSGRERWWGPVILVVDVGSIAVGGPGRVSRWATGAFEVRISIGPSIKNPANTDVAALRL